MANNNDFRKISQTLGYTVVDNFGTQYWNGKDSELFIDDILIDEFIQLQLRAVEEVMPVYPYNSYTASSIRHGVRIFAGEFSINFKQAGYIFSVLEGLRQEKGFSKPQTSFIQPRAKASDIPSSLKFQTDTKALIQYIDNYNEQIADLKSSTEPADNVYNKWNPTVYNNQGMFQLERGFDLKLVFGTGIPGERMLQPHPDFGYNELQPLTPVAWSKGQSRPQPATGYILNGTCISSISTSVDDSGRPIVETYSFICKNVQPLVFKRNSIQPITNK